MKKQFLALILLAFSLTSISAFNFEGDGVKIISPLENNGAIPVNIQDQTTEIIDYYLTKLNGTAQLTQNTSINQRILTVNSTIGASVGIAINIYENGHYYQALILTISGNNISVNAPLDFAFTTNAKVEYSIWNMNVNGVIDSNIFDICPPKGTEWDITRMIFSITDDSAMDDEKFGGINSLTRGIVVRIEDGYVKNLFSVNNNGGFAERAYDTEYSDKAPAGFYGFKVRRTFAGQDKNGVTIRLNGDDEDCLKVIIQDDLRGLNKFAVVAQGHKTTN